MSILHQVGKQSQSLIHFLLAPLHLPGSPSTWAFLQFRYCSPLLAPPTPNMLLPRPPSTPCLDADTLRSEACFSWTVLPGSYGLSSQASLGPALSLSFLGQGPRLWWFILSEAIYSSVNNYVWSSQDTSIGFSHKRESSLKSTL